MRRYLILFVLLFPAVAHAQVTNDSLEYRIRPDSARTGELHLSLYNFNFLRNYEYFNRIQDGYTLYGTQLEPQLVYYVHPRLAVMAGANLRKDYGGRGIYRAYPLFSIKYQTGSTVLIAGTLEGNVHHRYIEPLFDFEHKITDPVEYGTQVVVNRRSLFLDAFINWKRMIYKPSDVQEQILAGASGNIKLLRREKMSLSVPFQLTVFHQGGQIDVSPDPLITLVNTALGFKLQFLSSGFIQNVLTENYFVGYRELSPTKVQSFSQGSGIYLNASAGTRFGGLTVSYWSGNGYFSISGMPLYQSVSRQIDNPGYTQKHRSLLIARYSYQKQLIPNFYLDLRVEPLIDLKRPGSVKVESSQSLFLVYKQQFRLLKYRN